MCCKLEIKPPLRENFADLNDWQEAVVRYNHYKEIEFMNMIEEIEQKAKRYDEALERAKSALMDGTISTNTIAYIQDFFPELAESEDEQNILFEELKALHLRMEHQTVCNDAGGNRMWRRAWQHINEAINIIKEDKETYKW